MPTTASAPARSRLRSDSELLQGAWKTIAGRRQARFLIVGSRFAFEFLDGEAGIYIGSFKLSGDGHLRHLDMHIEEGPDDHRGQTAMCIYHLDADILRWCPCQPGAKARLTGFPSVDDDKYLSLVFKHDRPQRKNGDAV
jgi:hypothetical protein